MFKTKTHILASDLVRQEKSLNSYLILKDYVNIFFNWEEFLAFYYVSSEFPVANLIHISSHKS